MKTFYFTRYRKFIPKSRLVCKQGLRFVLLSDIHFSRKTRNRQLQSIADFIKTRNPDYILIPGDLVDCNEEVADHRNRLRLLAWLSQLGEYAPVFITPGNHDFYYKNPNFKGNLARGSHWTYETVPKFFADLRKLPNVRLLFNEAYEDDNLYILGFAPRPDYYQLDRDKDCHSTLFHPGCEDKAILLQDLRNLPVQFRTELPEHKIKLALFHSPIYTSDPDIAPFFSEFDFVISGHMHNGCVPPILNELWPSNRGLIGPGKILAPEHARLRLKNPNSKNIILGAVTTVQECAQPISFLNHLFPVNIAELQYTNDPNLKKTDVKFKYISFKDI